MHQHQATSFSKVLQKNRSDATASDWNWVCVSGVFQEWITNQLDVCTLQTYGIGGETLRGLTEKLRTLAHTLQMGIQGRWQVNSSEFQGATKLPLRVLQVVVELISSAKGLFSLLNRCVQRELSNCYIYLQYFKSCFIQWLFLLLFSNRNRI